MEVLALHRRPGLSHLRVQDQADRLSSGAHRERRATLVVDARQLGGERVRLDGARDERPVQHAPADNRDLETERAGRVRATERADHLDRGHRGNRGMRYRHHARARPWRALLPYQVHC